MKAKQEDLSNEVRTVSKPETLRAYVKRLLKANERMEKVKDERKSVKAQMKADGYNVRAVEAAMKRCELNQQDLFNFEEERDLIFDAINDLYQDRDEGEDDETSVH